MVIAEVVGPYTLASVAMICGVLVFFLRSRTKNLSLTLGNLHAEVKSVGQQVKAVDQAVNGRVLPSSTISEDITEAKTEMAEAKTLMAQFIADESRRAHAIIDAVSPIKGMLPLLFDKLDHLSDQNASTLEALRGKGHGQTRRYLT